MEQLDLKEYRDFYTKYLRAVYDAAQMEEEFNRRKRELSKESKHMHEMYMNIYHVLELIEVGEVELDESHYLDFFKKIKRYQAKRRFVKNLNQKYACLQKILNNTKEKQGVVRKKEIEEGLQSLMATHAKVTQDTIAGAKQLIAELGMPLKIKSEIKVPTYNRKILSCKTEGKVVYANK